MTKQPSPTTTATSASRPMSKKISASAAITSNGTNASTISAVRKRTHLKSSQIDVLQDSFARNPLPDSSTRRQLATQLGVTERTIQIWFQNRRAKARKLESFPLSTEGNLSTASSEWATQSRQPQQVRYQPTFRTMMTPELFGEQRQQNTQAALRRPRAASVKAPQSSETAAGQPSARAMSEVAPRQLVPESQHASTVPIGSVPLAADILRVGTWTRLAKSQLLARNTQDDKAWNLSCYGDIVERQLVWEIQADGHRFAVQIPFDIVETIRLGPAVANHKGALETTIEIVLFQHGLSQVIFKMQRPHLDHDWVRCGDFSEDKQASQVVVHVLHGQEDALRQSLFDLLVLTPDLASKVHMLPTFANNPLPPPPPQTQSRLQPQLPMLDLCRDITASPAATPTPEPFALPHTAPAMGLPPQFGIDQSFLLDSMFAKSVPLPATIPFTNVLPRTDYHVMPSGSQLMLTQQYPAVAYGTHPLI